MRSMRFKRLTAAICALSIAFTQTAILPISAYAADTDSTSFMQTFDDDNNAPENPSDTNGDGNNDNDGNGNGSDDDNGGDGSNNADPSDDNGDDANNTDDNDGSDDSNDADDSDGDGGDETDTDGIAVDNTNFPDNLFRGYVSDNFDADKDGVLSESEITAVKTLNFLIRNSRIWKALSISLSLILCAYWVSISERSMFPRIQISVLSMQSIAVCWNGWFFPRDWQFCLSITVLFRKWS